MSISQFIKDDLGSRLTAGDGIPAPLTLESLAEHYDVSLTPVRTAVAELVDQGLLTKGSNRRLMPGRRRVRQRPPERPQPPSPSSELLERVAGDFTQLSLDGHAHFLREVATAKKYGISRSAMRGIFHRLTGAGLLEHVPRRGWKIRPFRGEDLQAFLQVREVLELKALELAWPHLQDDVLQAALDRNVLPTTETGLPQIDDSFHRDIIQQAGNVYINDFFERHGRFFDLLFVWETGDRETSIETVKQHRRILREVLRRNQPAAAAALSYHIRENHPVLSKLLSQRDAASEDNKTSNTASRQIVGRQPAAVMVGSSYEL